MTKKAAALLDLMNDHPGLLFPAKVNITDARRQPTLR